MFQVADTDDRRAVLHIPDIARALGRTELATRRLIDRGQIPARKLGGRIVILRDEFDEFLRSLPRVEGGA